MSYIDYEVTQVGKTLTADKIKINKYDNKISRLVFNFDGTIPDGRMYCAFKNPVTNDYFYQPVTNSHVVIGTSITAYAGRWDMLLIVVSNEYDLDLTDDIDNSLLTYVSDEFKKIIVVDNFLDDDLESISYPAIDEALDNLSRAKDELENNVIQTGLDVTQCANILTQCRAILAECQEILDEIKGGG